MESTVDLIGFCLIMVGLICIGIPLTKFFLEWLNRKNVVPAIIPQPILVAPFKTKVDEIIASGILNKPKLPLYHSPLIHLNQVVLMEVEKILQRNPPLPPLRKTWEAAVFNSYVNFFGGFIWGFPRRFISVADYHYYAKIYKEQVLSANKSTVETWLNCEFMSGTSTFVRFCEIARIFADTATLNAIVASLNELFTGSKFKDEVLDVSYDFDKLQDEIEVEKIKLAEIESISKSGKQGQRADYIDNSFLEPPFFITYVDPSLKISIFLHFIRDYLPGKEKESTLLNAWNRLIQIASISIAPDSAFSLLLSMEESASHFQDTTTFAYTVKRLKHDLRHNKNDYEEYLSKGLYYQPVADSVARFSRYLGADKDKKETIEALEKLTELYKKDEEDEVDWTARLSAFYKQAGYPERPVDPKLISAESWPKNAMKPSRHHTGPIGDGKYVGEVSGIDGFIWNGTEWENWGH